VTETRFILFAKYFGWEGAAAKKSEAFSSGLPPPFPKAVIARLNRPNPWQPLYMFFAMKEDGWMPTFNMLPKRSDSVMPDSCQGVATRSLVIRHPSFSINEILDSRSSPE
jgi:hypothetical protein